ncbi:DUF2232 domain-containing protein [Elioraea rosea]|uniref:DUF2232 domain-containing protein n=1 Tax=Elioraea rosea TaxID=2492390 RepID=UPI0011820EBE|nr:DUF2232 domain-containing protein [Elioraea rosea]
MNARVTASLAGGIISALLALAAVRGLPLGGVLFWFAPLPLFAVAFGFGATATWTSLGAGALVAIVSGGPAALGVWLLLFGLPAAAFSTLALRGGPPALSLPFALLALWPAAILVAAEFALSDQPGGLSGVLRTMMERAVAQMGAGPELETAEIIDTLVRLKPLAVTIWFAVVTTLNASSAQVFMARRGLLASEPARWREARLPLWYAPVAVVPALVAGLSPGEAGFFASSLAMMLAVPLVMQGLAVVHVLLAERPARRFILAVLYVSLIVFMLPVGLALAGLGLAEFVLNLRNRPRGPRPGQQPPED